MSTPMPQSLEGTGHEILWLSEDKATVPQATPLSLFSALFYFGINYDKVQGEPGLEPWLSTGQKTEDSNI